MTDTTTTPATPSSDGPHERMEVTGLADYLAAMTKMVFQAGMGAAVVKAKWEGFTEAFDSFDCETVAALSPDDIDRLCEDSRIIRNRRKIEATVHNAGKLLDLEAAGGFEDWLTGHPSPAERDKALRREFKLLGPAGIEAFLWMVGVGGPSLPVASDP
ncbi:MAG: DNA-3-methyladenine glycosylase I [Acidimicrobiia bacterium]|nr:DNA-3-methyladenine glycosylase I [Acidimicrobiia bacterium]MDH5520798.1 DNA-3-methyladenine glycosylase I [Acidimicrobiia bacterium]